MNAREAGKAERRGAIVRAARRLVRETGQTGFSMRALAEAAGVSIATPYNLFGSKQAIMFALLDADLEQYRARLTEMGGDALDVFFEAVRVARDFYADDPEFYRATLFAVYNDGGKEFRSIFGPPRHAMWRGFVQEAVAAGFLEPDIDPKAFAVNLGHIFFSVILEWVAGELDLDELEARVQYGFALSLHSIATDCVRPRLKRRLREAERNLIRRWEMTPVRARGEAPPGRLAASQRGA